MTSVDDATPVHLRSSLGEVPAYVPGRMPVARPGLVTYKVSSNENPYAPLPSVLEVVLESAQTINRYPDAAVAELTQALADFVGAPAEDIVVGTGSSAILNQLVQATCDEGDEVVFAWRSFELYPIAVAAHGAVAVRVPLTADHRHDLDAMAAAITERTRVVIVCSPNNPSGPSVHQDELEAFLAKVPRHVVVLIDEAYLEFVTDEQTPDAVELYRAYPNVAVARTFSKAYGLAGLRVGYAIAPTRLAEAMRTCGIPFGVSRIAEDAAVASLAAYDELDERVRAIVAERERVLEALHAAGWPVPASQANFVFFPLGERCEAFAEACVEAGLAVRRYGDDGVRVTIAEPEANSRLLEVCAAFARD